MCYEKSIAQAGLMVLAPAILHLLPYNYWNDCLFKNVPRCTQSQLSFIWTDARFLVRYNIGIHLQGAASQTMSKFDRKQRDRTHAPYLDSYCATRRIIHCLNH